MLVQIKQFREKDFELGIRGINPFRRREPEQNTISVFWDYLTPQHLFDKEFYNDITIPNNHIEQCSWIKAVILNTELINILDDFILAVEYSRNPPKTICAKCNNPLTTQDAEFANDGTSLHDICLEKT